MQMHSIEALVQSYVDNHAVLGAAVAILQGGEIVYQGGFGTTTVEDHGVEVTPLTLFAYGSICKTLCATLVLRLVERGLLNLDTPIVQYLPELRFSNTDYGEKVTLRHLLSHTSGLPMAGKYWGPRDPESLGRFVHEQIPHYRFLAEPGTFHLYSNTVICTAGHIAEVVTGKFYDDLIQEYVFDPLHMERSTFDPAVALTYPIALPHKTGVDGQPQVIHRMTYNVSGNPSSFALGSVSDLANLAQMYLNRGNFGDQRILSGRSIDEMHQLHGSRYLDASAHPLAHVNRGYGLGFNVGHYRGSRTARHGGMSQSYNCFFDLFPDDHAGVVLLTNYSDEERLLELVVALYDAALNKPNHGIVLLEKPAAVALTLGSAQEQRYAGTFLNIETAELAAFSIVAGELRLEHQGKQVGLIPYGEDVFYGEVSETYRVSVAFLPNSDDQARHVMIAGKPYQRFELNAFQPDLDLWRKFEGAYKDPSNWNPEDIFTVRLKNETLFIAEGDHEIPTRAVSNRCFLCDFGFIEFEETDLDDVAILVWGKATCYYPLDEQAYRRNRVIRYLIDAQTY